MTRRRRSRRTPTIDTSQPSGSSFETLIGIDDVLVAAGGKPLSDWWRDRLREFYTHPTARTLAVCAGRGSAKSTALYRVALNETLFGAFDVPRGERHWSSLTSVSVAEASKGLDIISAWLNDLGVSHSLTPSDGTITLDAMPRGIRITAASVSGTSGWRSYFSGADEVAKWPTEGVARVDAREVLASTRAMTTTHRTARHMIVSSPFLDSGPFFETIRAGKTKHTFVVPPTPTWVASPLLTEDDTHALEANPRVWAREYAAQFGTEWENGYFVGLIDACVDEEAPHGWDPEPKVDYVIAIDPAFSRDQFVAVVAHHEKDGLIMVDHIEVIEPEPGIEKLEPTYALERVKELAEAYDARAVVSDQHHFDSLASIGRRIGLYLDDQCWTASNKGPLFELTRTLMRDRKLLLPNDAGLRRELASIGTRLLPSGHEAIQARPGMHDDRVTAMVMAVARAAQMSPKHSSKPAVRRVERVTFDEFGEPSDGGSRWRYNGPFMPVDWARGQRGFG